MVIIVGEPCIFAKADTVHGQLPAMINERRASRTYRARTVSQKEAFAATGALLGRSGFLFLANFAISIGGTSPERNIGRSAS
jgi:hypothetical protein